MSKADDIRAKGEMLASGPAQPVPSPRTDPFRLSVDLQPVMHDQLQRWVVEAGAEVGSRIPAARVVRVLLALMFEDDDLQRSVISELRRLGL